MSARRLTLVLLLGPLLAVLFVALALHSFDPATWPREAKPLTIGLAIILSLALASILQGDFHARA